MKLEQVAQRLPEDGAKRRSVRHYEKGDHIFHRDGTWVLEQSVWMDIEERYVAMTRGWSFNDYFIETIRLTEHPEGPVEEPPPPPPVVLTRWQRFKRWLGFSGLPKARLLKG